MTGKTTRRTFMKQAALAGATGPLILSGAVRGQNRQKLRHASIGVGGQMGIRDLININAHPDVEIVALCDVDERYLEEALEHDDANVDPDVRLYRDWRELLEEEQDNIDSVNIAVPNHMHAPIAMSAMRRDKHVYCQKPLTHSVYEARKLAEEAAKRPRLVTQMGVQTHSDGRYKTAEAMIQFGVVGRIKEAHSWDLVRWHYTGDFTDPPMREQPDTGEEPPDHLDWDLWLGVAPERPFNEELYHTRMWRRWHDFGGGAHGDMAGHMMDVVFTGLELTAPKWVMSYRSPPYEDLHSPDNEVLHRFPQTRFTAGDLDYYWHDTTEIDTSDWPLDEELPGNGSMLFGERGALYIPHVSRPEVYPADDPELMEALEAFEEQVGDIEGSMDDHYFEFVDACLGRGVTSTPFVYSGRMTETVLMGTNIANRFQGERLEWDARNLRFPNKPEAGQYLRRDYREGWEIEGLG